MYAGACTSTYDCSQNFDTSNFNAHVVHALEMYNSTVSAGTVGHLSLDGGLSPST